jgi:hypothetical protein
VAINTGKDRIYQKIHTSFTSISIQLHLSAFSFSF